MSYVIQNFNNRSRYITLTPRFKFMFILLNLDKFLIFFKFTTLLYFFNRINLYTFDYFFLFFKFFFSKQYVKLVYKLNLTLVGNYTNNLVLSSIFHVFNNMLMFIQKKKVNSLNIDFNDEPFFNQYWFSIKTLNTRISHLLYRNIFYFFLLVISFLWFQHTSFTKFYLNFLLITYHFQTSRFYNGYFLKIYNF